MDNQFKLQEAKKKVDAMIGLPNMMLRKGVARSGNPLTGFTDYNYKLLRDESREWTLFVEWVDLDGEGFRAVLPHKLVEAVLTKAASIMAQARKERAKTAVRTRQMRAQIQQEEIPQVLAEC